MFRFRLPSGVLRLLGVVCAWAVVVAAVVSVSPALAQSQNEVLTTVLYDGTPGFDVTDPDVVSGSAPESHTPGLDGGSQNLVVRTHDQFAVRVDWNVNEDAATNVVLEVVLPSYASWNPDVTGMFAGCDPATSTLTAQVLVCDLGDQAEGSNGAIRPVATLNEALENTTFDVVSTLTTDDDPAGVADGLDQELTVSEGPYVDYVKAAPSTSDVVNNGSEDGYVVLYPFTFLDFSQGAPIRGVGPMNDAVPIALFDHMWNLTPSVRLATAAEMTTAGFSGPVCGNYDAANGGAYVDGSLATSGTWACGAPTTGAGGYPVVPVNISGFQSRPPAATLSDGSVNGPVGSSPVQVTSGQIAVWMNEVEVQAAVADPNNPDPELGLTNTAVFDNALVEQDDTTVLMRNADGTDNIQEASGQGTSGPAVKGSPANNNAAVNFGPPPPETTPGGPGAGEWDTIHNITFRPGPLQLYSSTLGNEDEIPVYAYDVRVPPYGPTIEARGLAGQVAEPHYQHARYQVGQPERENIGQVARGQVLTLESKVGAYVTSEAPDAPLHGCTAFDNTHYDLVAFPAAGIPVAEFGASGPSDRFASSQTTVAPNSGPLAHVLAGSAYIFVNNHHYWDHSMTTEPAFPYTVEFSNEPLPSGDPTVNRFALPADGLTCNNDDDGSSGWVDANDAAALAAAFDADGDGRYSGITRARYTFEPGNWKEVANSGSRLENTIPNTRVGIVAHFSVQVKQDLAVNSDNQELHAAQSHSFGVVDANGLPNLEAYPGDPAGANGDCETLYRDGNWGLLSGNDQFTTTGWCNNPYTDDGLNSLHTGDTVDWDQTATTYYAGDRALTASATMAVIVGAKPGIAKTNLDGTDDVKDNGQLVQFKITPSVTGATVEALTNYVVTDNLPSHFQFVRIVDFPDVPFVDESSGQNIRIRYSDAVPDADPALPAGIAGGWPASTGLDASFTVEVMVTGAIANSDSATVLGNTASVATSGLGPWDPAAGEFADDIAAASQGASSSAVSFMPLPADEGVILKAVDTLEGPCVLHPDEDPAPAGWGDRCSMIGFEDPMSFTLSVTNEGNTAFTDMEFVDVFPHNADEVEPASGTNIQGGSPTTLGDGRTPDSDYAGTLGFVSMAAVSGVPSGATVTTWVSGDDPATISRDPAVTVGAGVNTWCDAAGGTVQSGPGACPATADDVTATYTLIDVPDGDVGLRPDDTLELRLTLDPTGHECDDVWTNTFGLRTPEILLPIRSNDVSIMVECEYDLALEKIIDPAFTPGADWLTEGTTVIPFMVEVTNQGDPVEDFDITDYVDTNIFTFDVANNPAGNTGGTAASNAGLPFTWDTTDPAAPVALVDGPLAPAESVLIPVNLTVVDAGGPLNNWAEISRFDNDGDPSNGDSDPDNANNPTTGPLTDEDSVPDADQAGDNQPTGPGAPGDGVTAGAGDGDTDPANGDPVTGDEDDHDVAGIPVYDLELIKTPGAPAVDFSVSPPTATFDITVTNQGNADVFFVDVTEHPPVGLTYVSSSSAASFTDASPVFTIDEIPAGDSVTIAVVYEMDLSQAPFTNAAEISGFDSDNDPNNAADPFAIDVDSTPGDTNTDDVIDHDQVNNDPDGDGNFNEATPGDEDDHDIETLSPYDLALQKTIESAVTPLSPDGSVTMLITVTNQAAPVATIDVVDYIDPTMWQPFDAALNADAAVHANSTAAAGFSFSWDNTDPLNPVALVTPDTSGDQVGFGETIVVPITLQPVDGFAAVAPLKNVAEIANFDNDEDPDNGDASDGTIADLDSTPDANSADDVQPVNAGDPGDDVIDGDGTGSDPVAGDEDDHDPVFIPVYDLELIKTPGDPVFDFTTTPPTVSYVLTVNNQGTSDVFHTAITDYGAPGLTFVSATSTAATFSAANPTFTIESVIAPGASETITVVYEMDLTQAPFTNAAEISAFDDNDDPSDDLSPFAFDVDSTPDATNDDDVIDHDVNNNDPDGDGNVNEATPGDEDDHDIETVSPYDLALQKTYLSTDTPLLPNGSVTMLITVTNQLAPVSTIDVTDYIDAAMWQPFNAALNADGAVDASSTATGFSFSWDASDPLNPVAQVTPDTAGDQVGFGETIVIPITLQPAAGFDATKPLKNVAEISNFDNDEDPDNGDASTGAISDVDSTPDADSADDVQPENMGDPGDDVVTGDGSGSDPVAGDEDDHDPVFIPVMDLALRKSVDLSTEFPISVGAPVTFSIEVFNQGSTHATGISLVDYVDPAMWDAFDTALNPAGADYTWAQAGNGQDGVVTISSVLAPGDSVVVPVTLIIASGADLEMLSNTAEISGATASDADGNEVTNPDGSPVVDIDSNPDAINDDPLSDDVVDGADGDEDDHDIALVTAPTYNLGNQVWFDTDNDGTLDADETPVEGVIVELFTDADGDGLPDDTNGDGIIDSSDAVGTTTTGPDGDYLFTDLAPGDYIVGIAPSNWDSDGALYGTRPSDPVSTDPNDDVDDDNNGAAGPYGYTWSGPVTLDDTEPAGEAGLNNDPNHPDTLSNLTVDFGFYRPIFDLALEKTLAADQPSTITVGDEVTFTIEVINQGMVSAIDMEIVDYLPASMTLADSDWTANSDGTASIRIAGPLAAGASTTVDVTVTIVTAGAMDNHAEITDALPIDKDGNLLTMPNGEPIPDIDSVFDADNSDVLTDGVTNENGNDGGDEDDHDIASLVATTPSNPPESLASTGANSRTVATYAMLILLLGAVFIAASRKRKAETA